MQLTTRANLSPQDQTDLEKNEAIIQEGKDTFVKVGNALMDIRDRKLYRAKYGTFEDYCLKRWGFTRQQGYRLMAAAQVGQNILPPKEDIKDEMSPRGDILPTTEKQIRPLTQLDTPEKQRAAWKDAVETAPNGNVTAAHVESVVAKYKPEPPTVSPAAVPPPESDEEEDEEVDTQPPAPVNRAYKNSSESNEWYTPSYLIKKATSLLGVINLDPASSEVANKTVQALHYYTIKDNGLKQKWVGNVWCNPPYGDDVAKFVEKMVSEYEAGRILEGLMLVAARTDTQWFRKLRAFPRCFIWGRVKFIKSDTGEDGDPAGFPSMLVYFGSHPDNFVETFKDIGDVYALWGAQ